MAAENETRRGRAALIVEMDRDELAVRIAEGVLGLKRPDGSTAAQALAHMRLRFPEEVEGFERAAVKAMLYFKERSQAGSVPS